MVVGCALDAAHWRAGVCGASCVDDRGVLSSLPHSSIGNWYGKAVLTSSDLLLISRQLPALTSLECAVDLTQSMRLFFGASLKSLELRLNGKAKHVPAINDAIDTISRLPNLEHLDLRLPKFYRQVSFAPLAAASRLRILDCYQTQDIDGDTELTTQQLDQLRALPHLRKINVEFLSTGCLVYLLRAPHSLQSRDS